MKILFFAEASWPHLGGIEKVIETLMLGLIRKGHECCIVTSCMNNLPEEECYQGIHIIRLPLRQGLDKNISAYQYSIEKIKQIKHTFLPDVYHLNISGPSFFYHLQTLNIAKAPTVFTFHYLLDPHTQTNGLLAKMLAKSDAITAGSKITLQYLHAVFPEYRNKSHLIHFGLEAPPIPKKAFDCNSQIILSWGRMVENKGFANVLLAIAKLRQTFPDLVYYLIGDGPDTSRLKKMIQDLDIEKQVVFPQKKYAQKDLFDLIASSRFVINPSQDFSECFGLVSLEAMQMGRTVLTTKHPGLNELVIDGLTGLTYQHDDIQDLTMQMTYLLRNHEVTALLSNQAYQHVEKLYSLDKMIDAYEKLYCKLQEEVEYIC